MAIFKTSFEVILASEEEVKIYYETAAQKINLLLEKYDIRNAENKLEKVSAEKLRALLSFAGFFQATPLKTIFFDQKKQFVPQEIIYAFREIISSAPINIKAVFFNTFIKLLSEKKWDKPLSAYFEKRYNFPSDGVVILEDLKDFSLGLGVYKITFQLRIPHKEKIVIFLKGARTSSSYNELLYFYLQKELLFTARYAEMPCILSNDQNKETLLLSPMIPGVASDTVFSVLIQAYRENQNNDHKFLIKKTLEILIEAFISHAALGDLLGRNDRHLMNSMFAFVIDGMPQSNTLEDLLHPEKFLVHVKNIVAKKIEAISLVDIDLKWMLEEQDSDWVLVNIDFGLSELNLLSLLPEFNDYHSKTNSFFEKRKEYITYYFKIYCQKQTEILEKKEWLFSAIKKIYPPDMTEKKLGHLTQKIGFFEKNKQPVVKLFERYLLNYRIRWIHKETLTELTNMAKELNNEDLLNSLKEMDLLKYLSPESSFVTRDASVLLQLQCFRGVLSRNDRVALSATERTPWEAIASNIAMIAEKFNPKLFKSLEDKKQFIQKDTEELLKIGHGYF